jgi:hypothetical protein
MFANSPLAEPRRPSSCEESSLTVVRIESGPSTAGERRRQRPNRRGDYVGGGGAPRPPPPSAPGCRRKFPLVDADLGVQGRCFFIEPILAETFLL